MRILAFDCSTDWLSVALGGERGWLLREERAGTAASERALPLVHELLDEAELSLREVDGIAFGAGPGSFTGVRIACGLAQGLALGTGRPVLGVSTLLALAHTAWRERGSTGVIACLDARMREVYVAAYRQQSGAWSQVQAPAVSKPGEVEAPPGTWHGCGDGFAAYPELAARLGLASVDVAAHPRAMAIGELALPRFVAGEAGDAATAEPIYVRHRVALTTAERAAGLRL